MCPGCPGSRRSRASFVQERTTNSLFGTPPPLVISPLARPTTSGYGAHTSLSALRNSFVPKKSRK